MEITQGLAEKFKLETVKINISEPFARYPRIYVDLVLGVKAFVTKIQLDCIFRTWDSDVSVYVRSIKNDGTPHSFSADALEYFTKEAKKTVKAIMRTTSLDKLNEHYFEEMGYG